MGNSPRLTRSERIRLVIGFICAVVGALVTMMPNQKILGVVLASVGAVLFLTVAVGVLRRFARPQ